MVVALKQKELKQTIQVKNRFNPKNGQFVCNLCGADAGVGVVIRGYVYCCQCGQKKKAEGIVK